ncbi:hypothetical protein [Brumicola pallidula]|uniref:Uncharacterized protein n=1 Tax=Brumicola pallidula DSM 14239 = ACAM 615 TaxID=1121922 RepID=K6YCJ8_9ALTE|nr:hypothetical protein [Glaciecola pallidula]GAC30464.1 hypothetical protein GPAL_3622 [Glaciecola pallidula DSM 14239 = ACAM 615]
MQDIHKKKQTETEDATKPSGFTNRRHTTVSKEPLFRFMVISNVAAWVSLIAALVLFHYARPEFISGIQKFWGVEGRVYWSKEHIDGLLAMLQVCLGLSLVSMILRLRRNRRKNDSFGINLFILASITIISLITLNTTFYTTLY